MEQARPPADEVAELLESLDRILNNSLQALDNADTNQERSNNNDHTDHDKHTSAGVSPVVSETPVTSANATNYHQIFFPDTRFSRNTVDLTPGKTLASIDVGSVVRPQLREARRLVAECRRRSRESVLESYRRGIRELTNDPSSATPRRHTRASGPVREYPNVQPRILEYIK